MTAWRIPLSDVDLNREEERAVLRVIRSGWLTIGGEVAAFEEEFARFCASERAVALSSASAALHLACVALGVRAGVEVIVPTLTFVASVSAVVLSGGRPVFADSIGPDDFTIDPEDVERRITAATRGVICVHYGGYSCRMDALVEVCERHRLFLIEDVAHAPGAKLDGKPLGTIGDVGCFSFFGNKNMTTGEGGMALAREPAILDRIRLLRSHGMTASSWDRFHGHAYDYDVAELGFNYRPTELTAALGRQQLQKLTRNNHRRNLLLDRYRARLSSVEGIDLPFAGREGVGHLAVALAKDTAHRDGAREALGKAGIQSSLHYPPVHLFRYFREAYGCEAGACPVAEALTSRSVTLPLYATMAPALVDDVCDCIADYFSAGQAADGQRRAAPVHHAP